MGALPPFPRLSSRDTPRRARLSLPDHVPSMALIDKATRANTGSYRTNLLVYCADPDHRSALCVPTATALPLNKVNKSEWA